MNRETRRKMKISKEQGDFLDRIYLDIQSEIHEGDKVKLRYEQITLRKDYPGLSKKYREFVESNKDTVFTAKIDEKIHGKYPLMELEEDETQPKFLFWTGDLEKI